MRPRSLPNKGAFAPLVVFETGPSWCGTGTVSGGVCSRYIPNSFGVRRKTRCRTGEAVMRLSERADRVESGQGLFRGAGEIARLSILLLPVTIFAYDLVQRRDKIRKSAAPKLRLAGIF